MWKINGRRPYSIAILAGMLTNPLACAGDAKAFLDSVALSGDFRIRLETDFDSQDAAAVEREDRTRARTRARLGLECSNDPVTVGFRLRSGSKNSQQSPHITIVDFDGNDTGDADFDPDQWFLKVRHDGLWAWAGRNSFPFWKQNELFWDDDVTPAGLAAGYAGQTLAVNAGYFSLPAGMREFVGNLGAGQLVFKMAVSGARLVAAGGVYGFDADKEDPDAHLFLSGNGLREYVVLVGSLQGKLPVANRALTLGVDLIHNAEDYDATEPDRDEDSGCVLSAICGQTRKRGDWLADYTYARIERLAVNSSFAQDDWVRWGSATQTRGSNVKGHELRLGYALAKNLDLLARLYLVESVTTVEDGNRFRIDLNHAFRTETRP
ncbi:MAG: putative porin [Candidatus Zixiibacteriota bacterium]